jgi:hypothetical protein
LVGHGLKTLAIGRGAGSFLGVAVGILANAVGPLTVRFAWPLELETFFACEPLELVFLIFATTGYAFLKLFFFTAD